MDNCSAYLSTDRFGACVGQQGALDNINLFSLITILSFFLLAPFTLANEGFVFSQAAMQRLGVLAPETVMKQALLAGVCFHAYQQV